MSGSGADDGGEAGVDALLSRLRHDLKQPLNLIRMIAQGLRIDLRKDRFEVTSMPANMSLIETTVDELTARIDELQPDQLASPEAVALAVAVLRNAARKATGSLQVSTEKRGGAVVVSVHDDAGLLFELPFEAEG